MEVYADLVFDASSPEGDMETFTITTRFRNREQLEKISDRYQFDNIITEIEEVIPRGYSIESEIEFGTIYEGVVRDFELDLSWVEV